MRFALLSSLKALRNRSKNARPAARSRRPLVESMEARQLLTNYAFLSPVTIPEGSGGGTTPMEFTVSLLLPVTQEVAIDYQTWGAGSTATSGVDFHHAQGTVTFVPGGPRVKTIRVDVIADDFLEEDKYFSLVISNPRNAMIFRPWATGMIADDDAQVTTDMSITDEQVVRGPAGTETYLNFSVNLNTPNHQGVWVYASTMNLTAVAGVDYEARAEWLYFAPGQKSLHFGVKALGSSTTSTTKIFAVSLTGSNVAVWKSIGYGHVKAG